MDTENNKEDKKNLEDELKSIKDEMKELKEMLQQKAETEKKQNINVGGGPTPPDPPEPPEFEFNFETEGVDPDDLGTTIGRFAQGVASGISANIQRSMGNLSRDFKIKFEGMDEIGREMARAGKELEREMKHVKREAKRAAREAKREAKRAVKDMDRHNRRVFVYRDLDEQELNEFYEEAPKLTSALADNRRLMILKALEEGPKYQGELSELTDLKGGSFKHHMDALLDLGYVYQEATRGRYLIKQLGVEALKLAEVLFRRSREEQEFEVEVNYEEDESTEVNIDEDISREKEIIDDELQNDVRGSNPGSIDEEDGSNQG